MRTNLYSQKDEFLSGSRKDFPKGLVQKYQAATQILNEGGRLNFMRENSATLKVTFSNDALPLSWIDLRRQHFALYEHLGLGGNLAEVWRRSLDPLGSFTYLLDAGIADARTLEDIAHSNEKQEIALDLGITRLETGDIDLHVVKQRSFQLQNS